MKDEERRADAGYGCKILETILAHHRGKLDGVIPNILQIVCTLLVDKSVQENNELMKFLLDDIAAVAYYNPQIFLRVLDQSKALGPIFNIWLSYLPEMKG